MPLYIISLLDSLLYYIFMIYFIADIDIIIIRHYYYYY